MTRLACASVLAIAALAGLGCAGRTRLPLPLPPTTLSATPEEAFLDPPEALPWTAIPAEPEVETRTLPNGMQLMFVRRADLPVVDVRYACRASGTQDRDVRPGVDALLERVLGQLGHLHAPSLRGSSEPTVDVHPSGVEILAEGASGSLGGMIDTIAHMVREPGYNLEVLVPPRHQLLQTIAGASQGSSYMRGVHEREMIFGPRDPRAGTWWGTAPEFGRLHPEDLAARHAQLFTPTQSVIVVVGDATIDDVEALVRGALADWSAPEILGTPLGPAAFPRQEHRLHAFPAGGDESVLYLYEHAPPRDDADRPAFEVVTALLGGMFSARMNHVLREEQGHTYGIHTRVGDYRTYAVLEIELAVPAVHMRSALLTMIEELGRVSQSGAVDAEELATARASALASYRYWFFSRRATALALTDTFLRHTTIESLLARARAVETVTAEEVTAAAQHWIRVDGAPILVVGPYFSLAANIHDIPGGSELVIWRF